jgi:hypothetical protein
MTQKRRLISIATLTSSYRVLNLPHHLNRNLRSFRAFYLAYQDRLAAIWQKPSAKLAISEKASRKSPFTLRLVDWVREQEVAYGAGNLLREDHF